MPLLRVLRVFTDADGRHGNPLGVFLDGPAVAADERQAVAADLGFSETVFVDDRAEGAVQIFTPAAEIPFAGHPTVGAAWLLAREGEAPQALQTRAGAVGTRVEGELTFVRAPAEWAPAVDFRRLDTPNAVEAADPSAGRDGFAYLWAWADEAAGEIRARSFPGEWGIAEDEATGSAVLALCSGLGRPIAVRQGRGSLLFARPLEEGWAEVGGRVGFDEARAYELGG